MPVLTLGSITLAAAVLAASAGASPPPTGAPPRDAAAVPSLAAPDDDTRDTSHALVVARADVGAGSRNFDYVDKVSRGQRSYALGAAPLLGVGVELYPFARSGDELLGAFGLTASYARAALLESATASDHLGASSAAVDTSWSQLDVGLRGRMLATRGVALGARIGYGRLDFQFGRDAALSPELPSVAYRYARLGLDARVAVLGLALLGAIDYLAVVSAGSVAERYPHATVGGIEAFAALALPITKSLEVRGGARYQRFFYGMHPELGDPSVAGGALDVMMRGEASLAFHY